MLFFFRSNFFSVKTHYNYKIEFNVVVSAGRFDEDGSFIGQYGTLQRQIREQQQQLQQREQQVQHQQRQQPQFWRENSNTSHHQRMENNCNGQRISGAMPPHHAYFPSKSAAGGTYV